MSQVLSLQLLHTAPPLLHTALPLLHMARSWCTSPLPAFHPALLLLVGTPVCICVLAASSGNTALHMATPAAPPQRTALVALYAALFIVSGASRWEKHSSVRRRRACQQGGQQGGREVGDGGASAGQSACQHNAQPAAEKGDDG